MNSNCLLVLILCLSFSKQIKTQSVSCVYEVSENDYFCHIAIINPNGFDNFTQITGEHVSGKNDYDVNKINTEFGTSNTIIFPSIVCEKFHNLIGIDFRNQILKKVGPNSFTKCENLKELRLIGNSIGEISEEAFASLVNLKVLDFKANQIVELPRNVFSNLINLKQLRFSSNLIQNLHQEIFSSQVNLEYLHFAMNQITELPKNIFSNLIHLEQLYFYSNYIQDLPRDIFKNLHSLYSLFIGNNNISIIHSDSFNSQSNLQNFYFENNTLNAFDENIIINSKIRLIDTSHNPCSNRDAPIIDNTESRSEIRAALQQCFENYKERCEIEDISSRVCQLEKKLVATYSKIENLKTEKEKMAEQIEQMYGQIEDLHAKNENLKQRIKALETSGRQ